MFKRVIISLPRGVAKLSTGASGYKRTVAITGASGHIGTILREHLNEQYDIIGIVPPSESGDLEYCKETIPADLTIADEVTGLFSGADAVIHLANEPSPFSTWDTVYRTNIAADGNVITEAGRVGIARFVYASSNHANFGVAMDHEPEVLRVGEEGYGFHKDKVIHLHNEPFPDSYYGCGKILGEALLRYHCLIGSLSGVSLRIGWVIENDDPALVPKHAHNYLRAMFLSQRDCAGFFTAALNKKLERSSHWYQAAFAVSHNSTRVFDLSESCDALDYSPQDSSDKFFGHAGEASQDVLEGVE